MALLVVVVAVAACSNRDPNAATALIRWRFYDAQTGTQATRCTGQGALDGNACCVSVGGRDITIDVLRLRAEIIDPDTGAFSDLQDCPTCCFHCYPNEWTVSGLPTTKTYRLSLYAYACGQVIGNTPAPLVRTLGPGDNTNVQVQQVLLRPNDTLDPVTGGAICPRGAQGACCPGIPATGSDAFSAPATCPPR